MLPGPPPAVAGPNFTLATTADADADGVEDVLAAWRDGALDWAGLRAEAVAAPARVRAAKAAAGAPVDDRWRGAAAPPTGGTWERGLVRIVHFGGGAAARARAARAGRLEEIHALRGLDARVLAMDAPGLRAYLDGAPGGAVLLDRDGVPALDAVRPLVGMPGLMGDPWRLGDDWFGTVAVLDSGCDTAHGDLGDRDDDDRDGPAPAVGDAADWYPADGGWPLFDGYKVVGWHDVTDDFPEAQGPWDYHHHGTALASAVAGAGHVDPTRHGVAPGARLTVVKFYDFDVTWHAWAGDFLAAVDWVLDHRETYRVRAVLAAVNWDTDAGITAAVRALAEAGVPTVAAMGNFAVHPAGPGYPARLPDVLTCGGVNHDGAVAAFSGRGLPWQAKPDLVAPAGGLLPERGRVVTADNEPDDSYSGRWGTSLAAAHAAGALHVLEEAARDRGTALPGGRDGVRLRLEMLRATAAPVDRAESPDGTGTVALPASLEPDAVRGAGLLRIDAAVAAVCEPLLPGVMQTDTIGAGWERPVAARRLATAPDVRYLVEAQPQPGLDVSLHVVDPWGRLTGLADVSTSRDASGAGVSEFVYVRPAAGHWLSLVVKRVSGEGTVALRLLEADAFAEQGRSVALPGRLTGNLNAGDPFGDGGPAFVVPSRVTVDDAARALTVLRPDGSVPGGWPAFVFPHVSAQGGMLVPLVWDLDDQPGDEIVVSSEYGTVYFFDAAGGHVPVELALNRDLTAPVGLEAADERRVLVLDALGGAWTWAAGAALRAQAALGHASPLAPAAGVLSTAGGEAAVVAFADGTVLALDADLQVLPGWPRDLGVTLAHPPVLADLDEDGDHEVVLPVLDTATGTLRMRTLQGDGTPGPGDGTVLPAPGGGSWLEVSTPLVTGRYGTGELGVTVAGLAVQPLDTSRERWSLATATLRLSGAAVTPHPTLRVETGTDEGQLQAGHLTLAPPLAWDQTGGTGVEPAWLLGLDWIELLYGVTSIPGGTVGWFTSGPPDRPLAAWQPLRRGGPSATGPGRTGAALAAGDGVLLKAVALDDRLHVQPQPTGDPGGTAWVAARGDGRNSGALALRRDVSGTRVAPLAPSRLRVYPNPGSGRIHFRLEGDARRVGVEIFDLRGRRVRRLAAAGGAVVWDGRDGAGRALAAGAYLAVVRHGERREVRRLILTR